MKLYAIETTAKGQLCEINARNVALFATYDAARNAALDLAMRHPLMLCRGRAALRISRMLDGSQDIYIVDESNREQPVAWITERIICDGKWMLVPDMSRCDNMVVCAGKGR